MARVTGCARAADDIGCGWLAVDLEDYDRSDRYDRASLYSLSSDDGYGPMSSTGAMRAAANLIAGRRAP